MSDLFGDFLKMSERALVCQEYSDVIKIAGGWNESCFLLNSEENYSRSGLVVTRFSNYGIIKSTGSKLKDHTSYLVAQGFRLKSAFDLNNEEVINYLIKEGRSIYEERVILNPGFNSLIYQGIKLIHLPFYELYIGYKMMNQGVKFFHTKSDVPLVDSKKNYGLINDFNHFLIDESKTEVSVFEMTKGESTIDSYVKGFNENIVRKILLLEFGKEFVELLRPDDLKRLGLRVENKMIIKSKHLKFLKL